MIYKKKKDLKIDFSLKFVEIALFILFFLLQISNDLYIQKRK